MKTNTLLILSFAVLILTMVILNSNAIIHSSKVDCSKPFNVIYLKPSEMSLASTIINKEPNSIIVFPELNQLNAKTEVLNCASFDASKYIKIKNN